MTKAESEPFERPLRVFAFDPSRGRSKTNVVTLRLPYEPLEPGPIGRYVAVIDHDTAEDRTYEGVDLGAREAMMSGGLDPSETDVRFHQQMAYAVATRTIQAFEQALGRPIRWPWASGSEPPLPQDKVDYYPHAERVPNAWFLPQTGEMCLGYDVAAGDGAAQLFYTCLSYDIVAHQTVHPLLQSVFPRFADGIDPDTAAFHEGLADLVALLQHFDFDDAVLDAVEGTGGRIWELSTAPDIGPGAAGAAIQAQRADTNPLLEIGRQLARAEGMGNTIRSVLGSTPIRRPSRRRRSPTSTGPSWWRRCSMRSSRSTPVGPRI